MTVIVIIVFIVIIVIVITVVLASSNVNVMYKREIRIFTIQSRKISGFYIMPPD